MKFKGVRSYAILKSDDAIFNIGYSSSVFGAYNSLCLYQWCIGALAEAPLVQKITRGMVSGYNRDD